MNFRHIWTQEHNGHIDFQSDKFPKWEHCSCLAVIFVTMYAGNFEKMVK
jgi:hypothetical protein